MNIPRILAKVYREPWAITPETHEAILAAIEAKLSGQSVVMPMQSDDETDDTEDMMDGSTAIIPVHGILGKHLDAIEMACGGCSYDNIQNAIKIVENDVRITDVVFDFRSPGGDCVGCAETAEMIADLAENKRTWAFSDSNCCSASIYLASQCQKFYITQSAKIGCIGTRILLLDESKSLENEGIKVNAISSGKYKLSGASFKPLTDDERAMFQSVVDKFSTEFFEAMQLYRECKPEHMQGQCYYGKDAVDAGMCDGLVDDLDELLEMCGKASD